MMMTQTHAAERRTKSCGLKPFDLITWVAPLRSRWRNRYRLRDARAAGVSRALVGLLLGAGLLPSHVYALEPGALPTGGKVIAGGGAINQSGKALTVTQTTPKLIANWTSFSSGTDASV